LKLELNDCQHVPETAESVIVKKEDDDDFDDEDDGEKKKAKTKVGNIVSLLCSF
jgi:hypothetical protein